MKTSFTHGNFSKYLYNKESVLPKSRVLINLHKGDDDDDDNLYFSVRFSSWPSYVRHTNRGH